MDTSYIPDREMSKAEYNEYRSCKIKRNYRSKRAAKDTCKNMKKRVGAKLEPYKCKFCDYWHVGNKDPRTKEDVSVNEQCRPHT